MSVNPSSLSMHFSPSPAPESPEPGPSRKRPRTAASSEDRKEARAHRNRIAAQNSRDRRKAQFSYLERRVTELEEENKQLRAGLLGPPANPDQLRAEDRERDKAKERENEELRERIKTLEKGWDAVMKALAAQGLSTASAPASDSPSSTTVTTTTPDPPVSQQQSSPQTNPQPFPAMTFPISPAPSHTSLDFDLDLDLSSSSSFMSSPVLTPNTGGVHRRRIPSADHGPAAGGLDLNLVLPGTDTDDTSNRAASEEAAIDDATMEDLFREILAPSPRLPAASLPFDASGGPIPQAALQAAPPPPAAFPPQVTADGILGLEALVGRGVGEVDGAGDEQSCWTNELEVDMLEMDRILGLLPAADAAAFPHNLEDLGLGPEWGDMESFTGGETPLVGAF